MEEELNYDPSIKHLVLDLQDTTFIDSSGLGVILGRFKRISAQGGKLLAVRVPSHLVKVFELPVCYALWKSVRPRRTHKNHC